MLSRGGFRGGGFRTRPTRLARVRPTGHALAIYPRFDEIPVPSLFNTEHKLNIIKLQAIASLKLFVNMQLV